MELSINKRIEAILIHFKISQKQLAEQAGLSENTISNAKKGKNIPTLDFFNSIYKAFPNISPQWLYLGNGKMFRDDAVGNSPFPMHKTDSHEECLKKEQSLLIEIEYLKAQIKDKEEIIQLLKSNHSNI